MPRVGRDNTLVQGIQSWFEAICYNGCPNTEVIQMKVVEHSEKFEMNEEMDSLLSEKISNFLLT